VYSSLNPAAALKAPRAALAGRRAVREGREGAIAHHLPRTVLMLGLTSLFTDISSEMVVTILPLYLIAVGGFTPLAFGVVDGLYNGAASFVQLAAGYVADRRERHKPVAVSGYGLSAICKLALVLCGTAISAIGAIVLIDRIGKGIRTAPRDAMISLSSEPERLGVSFGVHRALDTVGAMLGPLIAFAMLAAAPSAFNSVFTVSFCIALIGLGIIVLFVSPKPQRPDGHHAKPAKAPSLKGAVALLKIPRYRALVVAGAALSRATASDAFIFLVLKDVADLGNSMFPLLFVGSSAAFMLLAVPMGKLADRVGRARVLLCGYILLGGVYATLLSGLHGLGFVILALALLGSYYAATDGVLMALGSAVVPDEMRGTGLAFLGTATNVAKLVSSLLFGLAWTVLGTSAAIAIFGVGLAAAGILAAVVLHRTPEPARA
jgi:MFS family permease